jgi:hypothetical protein
MNRKLIPLYVFLTLDAGIAAACDSRGAQVRRAADSAPVRTEAAAQAPPDTIASVDTFAVADPSTEAYRQFAAFLSLAVASREPHVGRTDSVYTRGTEIGIEEQDAAMRWVADARILRVSTRGDSGRAVALITSVARQTNENDVWMASTDTRDDTVHWALIRNADTQGRWMVNGDAAEGFGVFHIGRDVRWVRGSRAQALAAIDSIRHLRGLELLR